MALQEFVKRTVKVGADNVLADPVKSNPKKANSGDAEALTRGNGISTKQVGESKFSEETTDLLADRSKLSLTAQEREILSSLAAVQIKYNRPAEAVPYLMMLRKTDRTDYQAARLLALALVKLGNWEQAETILEDINEKDQIEESEMGILAFYRSLVAFKRNKLSVARQWLQNFKTFVAGGAT